MSSSLPVLTRIGSYRRRSLLYSADDATHPHNDPTYQQADEEDAKANGVQKPYGMGMMFSVFVNYVIDTGALGLPYAFVESGWVLSIITLVACGCMSTIAVLFTLEAMARTTGILEWKERQDKRWRRRRKRQERQELETISDDDLDEYEAGEVEEEKEVLHALGESLRVNREINPKAKNYGKFLAASPADTPIFGPTPSASQVNLAVAHGINGTINGTFPRSSSGPTLPTVIDEPPLLDLGVNIQHIAPSTESSLSFDHLNPPLRSSSSHTHIDESTPLRGSNRSSAHASPLLNPLATGRGYAITSPAHHPEHVHLLLHNKPIHHLSYRRTDFTLMSQMFGGQQRNQTTSTWTNTNDGRTSHRVDMMLLACLFVCLGYPLSFLTQFSVVVFSYVSLWVTAAIFAQSLDTLYFQYRYKEECNIYNPNQSVGCYTGYYIIVAGYSVLVVYLSLKDIAETATTQALLTGYRFAAFAAMGITCIIASFYPNYFNSPDGVHPATWSPLNSGQAVIIPEVNWAKFNSIFTISVVSLMVQYNMPDIVQPMRTPYKRHVGGVVAVVLGAMVACVALYMVLGLVCALTIGSNAYPLITLNWSHYTGLDGGWGLVPHGSSVAWWAECIKLFIMLFPVISMISCFPLIAISLSENLRSSIPTKIANKYENDTLKVVCRMMACVPPLILTCVSGQVDLIFMVAGFVAFLIQLIIPCLLQWTSIRYCKRIWGPGSEVTPFSFGILSHSFTVIMVFIISCGFAAYSVVAIWQGGDDEQTQTEG